MNECFADSFVFFALLNPKDRWHESAVALMQSLSRPMVMTAWILTELADGLSRVENRRTFVQLQRRLLADARVSVVAPSADLFSRGMELYEARPDKDWSLTDCISFVVMRDRRIVDALTGDHHFEQAGFRAMLRRD